MHEPQAWCFVVSCEIYFPSLDSYLAPPARCHHLHSLVNLTPRVLSGCVLLLVCNFRGIFETDTNKTLWCKIAANMTVVLKYGAPFAAYGSILDSYGAAAVPFDLATQQKENNGRRSPKGERLRMKVGSVQKCLPTQRIKDLLQNIILRIQKKMLIHVLIRP